MISLAKYRSWSDTNDMAFNISYAASSYRNETPAMQHTFDSKEWRDKAFEFCTFSNLTCSLVLFDAYSDNRGVNVPVNKHYHQVVAGACSDTFTSPAFSFLGNEPPTKLIEQYLKCTESVTGIYVFKM
jgi:hypothetical protein